MPSSVTQLLPNQHRTMSPLPPSSLHVRERRESTRRTLIVMHSFGHCRSPGAVHTHRKGPNSQHCFSLMHVRHRCPGGTPDSNPLSLSLSLVMRPRTISAHIRTGRQIRKALHCCVRTHNIGERDHHHSSPYSTQWAVFWHCLVRICSAHYERTNRSPLPSPFPPPQLKCRHHMPVAVPFRTGEVC